MPAKIRLSRHGKKKSPYYHIIVADSRTPRDGKYIERIGSYNPNTNPATIIIDGDKALGWLQKGAQPTDTTRAILSYKGILFKNHMAKGVAKGALTQEEADKKFNAWMAEKEKKIDDKTKKITAQKEAEDKKRLAAEAEVKEAKAKAILAKKSALAEEVAAGEKEVAVSVAVAAEKTEAKEEVAEKQVPSPKSQVPSPKSEKEEAAVAVAMAEKVEAKEEVPKETVDSQKPEVGDQKSEVGKKDEKAEQ